MENDDCASADDIQDLYWRNYKTSGRRFDALCEYLYYLNRCNERLCRPVWLAFEYEIDWKTANAMMKRGKKLHEGKLKNEAKPKAKKRPKAIQKKKCGCKV